MIVRYWLSVSIVSRAVRCSVWVENPRMSMNITVASISAGASRFCPDIAITASTACSGTKRLKRLRTTSERVRASAIELAVNAEATKPKTA